MPDAADKPQSCGEDGSRRIGSLKVVLTTACNLGCSYCYQDVRTDQSMSWGVLRRALDLLLDSGHPRPELTFYGGEPLLELPLIMRAVEYIEAQSSSGSRVRVSVCTNGTLLDSGTRRFLARHGVGARISFDGVEAAQELRAPGTFKRLDRALVRLKDEYPDFFRDECRVSIMVSSDNVAHLAESFAYLLDRGVGEIAAIPLVTHDPGWRPVTLELLADQIEEVQQLSVGHFRSTGQVPFASFKEIANGDPSDDESPAMCSAATGHKPSVDVDGTVYGCVLLAESYQSFPTAMLREYLEQMRIGDIRERGFAGRLEEFSANAGIFTDKGAKHSSYRNCKSCRYGDSCSVCPVSIAHIPDNTDPNRIPDLQCALNLAVLTARESFIRETHRVAAEA